MVLVSLACIVETSLGLVCKILRFCNDHWPHNASCSYITVFCSWLYNTVSLPGGDAKLSQRADRPRRGCLSALPIGVAPRHSCQSLDWPSCTSTLAGLCTVCAEGCRVLRGAHRTERRWWVHGWCLRKTGIHHRGNWVWEILRRHDLHGPVVLAHRNLLLVIDCPFNRLI